MSVLVVGSLLGPMGLLIAVPTLAVVMVVLRRILINRPTRPRLPPSLARPCARAAGPCAEGGVPVTDAPDLDVIASPVRAA
jgi:hypothetical protein